MKRYQWIATALFFSIFLYAQNIKDTIERKDNRNNIFQKKLESLLAQKDFIKDIKNRKFLRRFYRQNSYLPLWFNGDNFNIKSSILFNEIENDITLKKDDRVYKEYINLINYLNSENRDNIHTELYFTSLYIDFLKHLIYGNIQWKSFELKLKRLRKKGISANWVYYRPNFSISELLLEPDIRETINEITPKRFGYPQLIEALKRLKELQKKGGWKKLPHFRRLRLGDTGQVVIKLRERLTASGDLKKRSCDADADIGNIFEKDEKSSDSKLDIKITPDATFDKCLEDAVKNFQSRHGLKADGVVGKSTKKVLNIPIEDKIDKILLNIDRVKWLPRDEDSRYIIVNIPEYMLHYIENGKEIDKIPVIVGKKRHNTPIFKEDISYIVLNPYWKVPAGIVRKEIIPHMIRDPRYLKKEGLEIHINWYEKSRRINPYSIYWKDYYHTNLKFPYRIMQAPGPKNALGKIKFKFPNRFNVYLHDTPTKRLFRRAERAFSHGCVRVSKPIKLFETIASVNNIDIKRYRKILRGKRKVQINLKRKIPVYIIYLTAGYNTHSGQVEFRDDIYGYDKMQKRVN